MNKRVYSENYEYILALFTSLKLQNKIIYCFCEEERFQVKIMKRYIFKKNLMRR